ncbi:MAG: hypothetical protein AB7R89_15155 [Dehalococcoidia bacterium]
MEFMQRAQIEIVRIEHDERMREAERFRRARMARQEPSPKAAARHERRFFVFRFFTNRPSEA